MLTVVVVARSRYFSRTASDYASPPAGFPAELLDRLAVQGIAHTGAGIVKGQVEA